MTISPEGLAIAAIVCVALVALACWRFSRAAEARSRAEADRRLDALLHLAVAGRLGVPAGRVAEAMAAPADDPLRRRLAETVEACETVFTAAGPGEARVAMAIRWKDGGTTCLEQRWDWVDLPSAVRARLLHAPGPVRVPVPVLAP